MVERTRDLKLRYVLVTFVSVLAAGVFSVANAQVQEKPKPTQITKISPDEVPNAVELEQTPDWYQRFSSSDLEAGAYPAWTGSQQSDVQLKLRSTSRWNLQLGLSSRNGDTGLRREEMWAGATYNITSRLSIGGSVGVESENFSIEGDREDQQFEPGIRLQSAFKF